MSRKISVNSFDELPSSFGINHLAGYLNISIENGYNLADKKDFPCRIIMGKRIINKDLFKIWLEKEYNMNFSN
jgi:hypothetical protein